MGMIFTDEDEKDTIIINDMSDICNIVRSYIDNAGIKILNQLSLNIESMNFNEYIVFACKTFREHILKVNINQLAEFNNVNSRNLYNFERGINVKLNHVFCYMNMANDIDRMLLVSMLFNKGVVSKAINQMSGELKPADKKKIKKLSLDLNIKDLLNKE